MRFKDHFYKIRREVRKVAVIDNRQLIELLEEAGELVRVKQEVDWDCEAGAIVRRAGEIGAPAPLFENIKDTPATVF